MELHLGWTKLALTWDVALQYLLSVDRHGMSLVDLCWLEAHLTSSTVEQVVQNF